MRRFHPRVGRQSSTLGLPVMVAFPASVDAMGAGDRATAKSSLPRHWRPRAKHTHVAVEDAIEQGERFMNIVRERNAQRGDAAVAPPRPAPIARAGARAAPAR